MTNMAHYNWEAGFLLSGPAYPKAAAEYQLLLDAGNLDEIESLLMERLDSAPQDIAFFLPAYRTLIKRQETGRAEALLQLHVDCLKTRGDLPAENALLQSILGLWPDNALVSDLIVGHLSAMYAPYSRFDYFLKYFNIKEETRGLEPLRQLELWLRYDEGRVVHIPAKGTARVRESNPKLGLVRVVFENGETMTLRIDEAQRLAQSLPIEHFLSQKYHAPARLIALAESDPAGLLESLFMSVNRPLQLNEIRDMLAGIVHEAQWSAWWGKVRKDPRLTVGAGAKPSVTWNSSAAGASSALADQFDQASPREKLDMYQRYAKRSEELAQRMLRGLIALANASRDADPALSLEIALTLDNTPEKAGAAFAFSPADLLSSDHAPDYVSGIQDRLARRKAVAIIERINADWPARFVRILQTETDTQLIGTMYTTLRDKGPAGQCDDFVRQTLSDPIGAPRFYIWLCKELGEKTELKRYINGDFLTPLLGVLDHAAFKGHHPALRKLFDLGESADKAVAALDVTASRRLLDALIRDRALEDYRKEHIRKEIFLRFPELHENKTHTLYVTKEALEKKRLEFEKLVREDIPHNTKEIQRTREYGDLRENFEYHAARHRQEMLSSRAKTLHDELSVARIIDPAVVDTSKISIGTRVTLRPASGEESAIVMTILGPWDSDPAANILSYTSAVGALLLNATIDSTVVFNEKNFIVEKIELWEM
jgi:transcription elongation factor GreA